MPQISDECAVRGDGAPAAAFSGGHGRRYYIFSVQNNLNNRAGQ